MKLSKHLLQGERLSMNRKRDKEACCENCPFYDESSGYPGHCQRYPREYADHSPTWDFPFADSKDWCGEHPFFWKNPDE